MPQCMLGYTPRADTPRGRHPLPSTCWDTPTSAFWIHALSAQCMLRYTPPCPVHAGIHMATAADGTHPTGMHSCLNKCVFLHGWSSGHLGIRIVYKPTVNINTYDSELCLKYY